MPKLYFGLESPSISILDTVTQQVVTGLLDELDLLRSFEKSIYLNQSFSSYSQYDDGKGAPTLNKNRCDVDVNYILDKSQVSWPVETNYTTTALGLRSDYKGNHTPVLFDPDAGIIIEHYTVACGIEMGFKLNFQTFDEALRAFDHIQTRYIGSLTTTPFDISYSYQVTVAMYKYLLNVFQAKQAYQNKTLFDYIDDTKMTEISFDFRKSQLGEEDADKALMIRCQNLQCLGQLTMDQKEPDAVRVGQLPDSFTINFDFMFQFGRPNLMVVNTPVSVENTPLDYHLFENTNINHHFNPDVGGVYQDLLVSDFARRSFGNYNHSGQIIRLPVYDDWFSFDNQYSLYGYRPIIIAHFTLDGPTTTLNIKQLDDVVLHDIVQKILTETGNEVFNYGGLFHIGIFANDLRLGNELVSINEDLDIAIRSDRPDKVYHLVISETTDLSKTNPKWDSLLVKYRYFFPMTIERNINKLIEHKFFYVTTDDKLLSFINKLIRTSRLKSILKDMVDLGEDTNEIFSYTQNAVQLADYLLYKKSLRDNYLLPDPDTPELIKVNEYYSQITSVEGRSLFVAFMEQCILKGYITLNEIPKQYLIPNQSIYPYTLSSGGYYGFNSPLRVLGFNFRPERRSERNT